MSGDKEKFFIDDPVVLLTNLKFFPTSSMTRDEKLNAMARLSALISAVLYAIKYEYWYVFGAASLITILVLKISSSEEKMETFATVPTYLSNDVNVTTVAPLYAEEHQIYPPAYDIYENIPAPRPFEEPLTPKSYPYGQYLTRTNLLPSDEMVAHTMGGQSKARSYINGAFTRHELAHRENMTRLYKKKLARRFRHNTNDTFSPYHSY